MSDDLAGRWDDIDKLLARDGPFSKPHFEHDTPENRKWRQFLCRECRVLVIGAGGLGCELLKDLALVGFTNIDVIDMDTIDYSNLNRQFLFRPGDVGKSKAEVAAAFVNKRIPGVHVKAHHSKIQDMGDSFYQKFHVVVAGLDSIPARRWMNETLCTLASKIKDEETGEETDEWDKESIIPLIDGGTEGFMGQTRVIFPHFTPCFECLLHLFPPDPLNFQECTLVSTPRQPQHCISWAMRFAWEDDPEHKGMKVDGDDPKHIQWIYEKALARAEECNIPGVDYKLTQGVVKRIIPAIASTNAIIAAGCANEAFKIATNSSRHLQNWMMYNGGDGVYTNTTLYEKMEDCLICSLTGCTLSIDPEITLENFIKWLVDDKDKFLHVTKPSIRGHHTQTGKKTFLHMTGFLGKQTVGNLPKKISQLVSEGDVLVITNSNAKGDPNARERNYFVEVKFKQGS